MSSQPRRKYPRRAPLTESESQQVHPQQKIEKLRDFTDSEFAPETSFVKVIPHNKSNPYLVMEDAGDRSFSTGGNGRRKGSASNHKLAGKEGGQFGLQTPSFEGKKGSVKNWRPLAKPVDPAAAVSAASDAYKDLWGSLRDATDRVFRGQDVTQPFESLYNKVELICVSRLEATLFRDLQSSFKGHVAEWMESIEAYSKAVDDQAFLKHMEEQWQDLCRKIKLIRCIFLVLDRTYCLHRSDIPSIWDMGISMCRQALLDTDSERKVYAGLLNTVERERSGDQVDRNLLKNVIRMLSDLTLYESRFEEKFITATRALYSDESRINIQEMDIPSYLGYVSSRLDQEENRFEAGMGIGYLQISTRKKLIPTVEQELIQTHQTTMITKGADSLIDGNRTDDMALLFNLLARTSTGLQELCRAFCEYIKKRGRMIVMDDAQDKDMVPAMLELKSKTDDILVQCFRNQSIFKDALREGFEHFINQRANKPAEMIAKFVDLKLKIGNKEVTEDQLDILMDRLLILFRYIHGKDVFEAFYKKDLAKRLLLQLSASVDSEKLMLQKLKTECGSAFTSRLENMFRDVENSKEELSAFEQFTGHPSHPSKGDGKRGGIDFAAAILTHGVWPTYVPTELTLPEQMTMYLEAFQQFYVGRHNGRKLQWLSMLGHCRVNAVYGSVKKEFQMSQMQAVVLLLFNDVDSLSFEEIRAATKIEVEELKRLMGSMTHYQRMNILNKSGAANVISVHDVYSYNPSFKHKSYKVKVNAIQAQETPEEEQKTQEGVFADRVYQVDAAIVRIMKTRKSLKHALLVAEIYKQLRFPVTPADLKKRIESLIERDYMARDREDQTLYNYVA